MKSIQPVFSQRNQRRIVSGGGAEPCLKTFKATSCSGACRSRGSVLECASPLALSNVSRPAESSRGLEHSRTLPRTRMPTAWRHHSDYSPTQPKLRPPAFPESCDSPPCATRHPSARLRQNAGCLALRQYASATRLWQEPGNQDASHSPPRRHIAHPASCLLSPRSWADRRTDVRSRQPHFRPAASRL